MRCDYVSTFRSSETSASDDKIVSNRDRPAEALCYNDIVQLDDDRLGKVKFIGALGFESDI